MHRLSSHYGRVLFLCLAIAVLIPVPHQLGRLDGLELRSLDWRFVQRGWRNARDDIVIVAVDEKSLADLEAGALGPDLVWKWPWPLSIHARLIRTLHQAGASAIAFDVLFSATDPRFSDGQEEMARAMKQSGRVFLAAAYSPAVVEARPAQGGSQASLGPQAVSVDRFDALDYVSTHLPRHAGEPPSWLGPPTKATFWTLPLVSLLKAARGFGNIDIPTMRDGVYRYVEPVLWAKTQDPSGKAAYPLYPHLSLVVAAHHLRVPLDQVRLERNGRIRLGNEAHIPLRPAEGKDTRATLLIDYVGTSVSKKPFPVYPYSAVLQSGVPANTFKNKIVLVGATAKAMSDIRMNPYSASTPGVETLAHVLDMLLQRRFLRETGMGVLGAILLVLACALAGSLSRPNMRIGSALTAGVAVLYIAVTMVAFSRLLLVLPLATPLLQIGLSYTIVMAYRSATEERAKREVRRFFELYVSKPVAKLLLDDPKAQELGGKRTELTVLFSDVRGFTTMSERLPPEVVVRVMNEYFDAMVPVVDRYQGTLDKFIGDALMVLFNAPLPQPDHARLAVETGLEMLRTLRELQQRWEAEGLPALDIGIGICTGVAVVGNIGSRRRHQYTALGDTVNTASRLESLNKEMETHLLISESTYYQVTGLFEVRRLPPRLLQGKEEAIGVYEVVGTHDWSSRPTGASVAPTFEHLEVRAVGDGPDRVSAASTLDPQPPAPNLDA